MAPEGLQLEELRLRVPGVSPAEADELARLVAELVAEGLANQSPGGAVDRLELRVAVPAEAAPDAVARAVAAAILKGLS